MSERQRTLQTIAIGSCVAGAFFVCGAIWRGWRWLYDVPGATPAWIPSLFGGIGVVGLCSLTRVASGRAASPTLHAVVVATLLGCAVFATLFANLIEAASC